MQKRGISAVVATVLIILITVAAIAIVWTFILPLVRESTSLEQRADLTIVTSEGYTSFEAGRGVCVQVKSGPENKGVIGIQFIFDFNGSQQSREVYDVPSSNQIKSYCFNNTQVPGSIAIAPIYGLNRPGAISSRVDTVPQGDLSSVSNWIDFKSNKTISSPGGVNRVYYYDRDGDGYYNGTSANFTSSPGGYWRNSTLGIDCNDSSNSTWINSTLYADSDGDGYGTDSAVLCIGSSNPSGYSAVGGDCDDFDGQVNPGASENCENTRDDNCNGQVNEGCVYSYKDCADAYDKGNRVNSIYNICPVSSCFNVYCNMDYGGSASIFVLDNPLEVSPESQCVFGVGYGDDHDSVVLWKDLTLKMGREWGIFSPAYDGFWTLNRDLSEDRNAINLKDVSVQLGDGAKPVSFPALNKVVWFDSENSRVVWRADSGGDIEKSFSELGIEGIDFYTGYGSPFYAVSDGVNQVTIGAENSLNAYLLKFDFANNQVVSESVPRLSPVDYTTSGENWFWTEEDGFGHMLYTVNGRVMYYGGYDGGTGYFVLGGPLNNLNDMRYVYSVWEPAASWQPGLDFFGLVDNSGSLWFADFGHDDGGYFGCDNDDYLGISKTNIKLTY